MHGDSLPHPSPWNGELQRQIHFHIISCAYLWKTWVSSWKKGSSCIKVADSIFFHLTVTQGQFARYFLAIWAEWSGLLDALDILLNYTSPESGKLSFVKQPFKCLLKYEMVDHALDKRFTKANLAFKITLTNCTGNTLISLHSPVFIIFLTHPSSKKLKGRYILG